MTTSHHREVAMELSLREQLLADYDSHEDAIEDASTAELWALGDWLAEWVPPRLPGPKRDNDPGVAISLEDLAERRGRTVRWLQRLRKLALATESDRLPKVTPRAYEEALRKNGWDLTCANASLVTRGSRLRDQVAVSDGLRELLGDEPVPDFGASWADLHIVRIEEAIDKLAHLIAREGLVFSPDADLPWFQAALERAERNIADIRAAVQERVRDARLSGVDF